jgi:hypothetical protein
MGEVSKRQLKANQENAKLGGVKTQEGKDISKYNAMKHSIFTKVVSDYEKDAFESIKEGVESTYKPSGFMEKLWVDRIAGYLLKLYRASKAENEFMKATLDPRVVKTTIEKRFPYEFGEDKVIEKVVHEGYTEKVKAENIGTITATYLRYEITLENRLLKAVQELERLQDKRKGKEEI